MLYLVGNYPMQTTAAPAPVAVSTIKTLMQVKGLVPFRIVEWGFSGNASAAATPGVVELIETGSVFATVTAYAAADLPAYDAEALNFNSGDPTANYISVGTSVSGYTSTVEGSITAVRNLAGPQQIAPTNEFIYQSPLGYRAYCQAGKSVRIRATFGASVNVLCYMILEF
jgi:hypothetical protein